MRGGSHTDRRKQPKTPNSKRKNEKEQGSACSDRDEKQFSISDLYAMLLTTASVTGVNKDQFTIKAFIDGGATLNAMTYDLALRLGLPITTVENNPVRLKLGNNQTTEFPRQLVETTINIEGFTPYTEKFLIMPIPEDCDMLLGLPWLRSTNPDINWNTLTLHARNDQHKVISIRQIPRKEKAFTIGGRRHKNGNCDQIMKYYRIHGHVGSLGRTKIISRKQFYKSLKKKSKVDCIFVMNINSEKDAEKAARFRAQGWDSLQESSPPELFEMLHSFKDKCFVDEIPAKVPPDRGDNGEHEIHLEDSKPISIPQFRQSPEMKEEIRKWTLEMVKAGIIRRSTSPWCFPTFCVRKPNGWRIVHDYRRLNAITKVSAFPIPRKEDIFDSMQGSKWFSTMDLMHGYFQVRLREADIPYTAFATPDGLYEYLVTPHVTVETTVSTQNQLKGT